MISLGLEEDCASIPIFFRPRVAAAPILAFWFFKSNPTLKNFRSPLLPFKYYLIIYSILGRCLSRIRFNYLFNFYFRLLSWHSPWPVKWISFLWRSLNLVNFRIRPPKYFSILVSATSTLRIKRWSLPCQFITEFMLIAWQFDQAIHRFYIFYLIS